MKFLQQNHYVWIIQCRTVKIKWPWKGGRYTSWLTKIMIKAELNCMKCRFKATFKFTQSKSSEVWEYFYIHIWEIVFFLFLYLDMPPPTSFLISWQKGLLMQGPPLFSSRFHDERWQLLWHLDPTVHIGEALSSIIHTFTDHPKRKLKYFFLSRFHLISRDRNAAVL